MTSAVVVIDIEADEKTKEFHIRLKDETEIMAKSCVIATGGTFVSGDRFHRRRICMAKKFGAQNY